MIQIWQFLVTAWQLARGRAASVQGTFPKADLKLVLEASGHSLEEITKDARSRGRSLVSNAQAAKRRAQQSVQDEWEALRRAQAQAKSATMTANKQEIQGRSYLNAVRNLGSKD